VALTATRGAAILLNQANYWSAQGRPELAQQALDRLLSLEPNNPEVLASAVEVATQNGEGSTAETYLARLHQIAPGSPSANRAAAAMRAATVDPAALAEARRLAQAGQREAAMQRYREIFPNGEVPDMYAAEYYQTLASTSFENFREARLAMEQVAERSPENRSLQLTYAQMLTYRETTRADGIERLRVLAQSADMASGARAAWRQALLWQGPSGETVAQIEAYLQLFPGDAELQAKLDEAKSAGPDPQFEVRMQAFEALNGNRFDDAERGFESAIAVNVDDVDAIIGLGMVRRHQSRQAEARQLLDRAVALVPDRRDEFLRTMGYVNGDGTLYTEGGGRGGGNARVAIPSVQARQALQRGQLDQAENFARRAARGDAGQQTEAAVILGQIAVRRGDYSTAEVRFREALSRRRNLSEAQGALYNVLLLQGRYADADRFVVETGYRPTPGAQAFRSSALREEAQRSRDVESQIALLRGALAADSGNAWAAYDLSRLLKSRGQRDEARRIEQDLVSRGTPDMLFAASLLSNADGRLADTVARLQAIPADSRSAEASRLLAQNQQALEVRRLEQAARGNPRSEAAQRLLALAARPDPTGETPAAVIRAFTRLRQTANADAAARAANPGSASTTPVARVAIAGALLDAGRSSDAEALASSVERDPRLGAEARQRAASVRTGSAVVAADRLSYGGDRRAALDRLTPALSQAPENPQVQLSLARIYAGSGRAAEASEIAEGVLRRDSGNVQARAVAGEAAVARNAIGRAEEILREGRANGADELQMALLDARIARARSDHIRARHALEAAARLRGDQLRGGNP
jgi:Tfp pilus assembly protein PilF